MRASIIFYIVLMTVCYIFIKRNGKPSPKIN